MKFTSSIPGATHHGLDNAEATYTESEISETRSVLAVICVFTVYPVFWSLLEEILWNACRRRHVAVDVTSYPDEQPRGLLGLENQTGSNANAGKRRKVPPRQRRVNIHNEFDCNVFLRSKSYPHKSLIAPLGVLNVSHPVVSQNVSGDVVEIKV
ncbi:hypothetical protein QTP88_003880 [Uroleucon formosanum]